jgi:Ca2+-binding RTX toxin-like protein
MIRRVGLVISLTTIAAIALTPVASGFQQNFIRQIHPDNQGMFDAGDWVELQMYADGQNLVAGAFIKSYFGDGTLRATFQFPSNANTLLVGQNQRTILVSNTSSVGGTTPDFNAPLSGNGQLQLVGQDGAVCYESPPPMNVVIDCVAYGAFTATGFPTGSPAVATQFGQTLERGIGRGCPTALDPLDDSNDSAADFALSTRPPRNNATPPTDTVCPPGTPGSSSNPIPPGGTTTCGGKPITMSGTNGADKLSGTPGADVIAGQLGNDVIKGLAGKDSICGGRGRDRLLGGKGNDKLLGEAAKDTLKAGPGKDTLKGGPAADTLKGGPGADKLKGGAGKDVQIQ